MWNVWELSAEPTDDLHGRPRGQPRGNSSICYCSFGLWVQTGKSKPHMFLFPLAEAEREGESERQVGVASGRIRGLRLADRLRSRGADLQCFPPVRA